jgi:hypothetical protein
MPRSRTAGPSREQLDDDVEVLHNNIVDNITGFENLPRGNFAVFSVIEFWHQTLFSSNLTLPQRNAAIVCINGSIAKLCADAHLRLAPQISCQKIMNHECRRRHSHAAGPDRPPR